MQKDRSLPLDKGHCYRTALCVWKNEVPVFKKPATGAIKRKHLSYMAYLGENLMVSLITKALTCIFKEESHFCVHMRASQERKAD